jgi:branched-chain amino acid transport system permease protein
MTAASTRAARRRRMLWYLAAGLVVLLALSPVLPNWALFLASISLSKGLVVLGLLLLMRTGLVSFGQGLFYAAGGYAAGTAANLAGVTDALAMAVIGTASAAARSPPWWGSCSRATGPSSSRC